MNATLKEGQLLRYVGKNVDKFDTVDPLLKFLGYDSNGWSDIWVEHNERRIFLSRSDVQEVEEAS